MPRWRCSARPCRPSRRLAAEHHRVSFEVSWSREPRTVALRWPPCSGCSTTSTATCPRSRRCSPRRSEQASDRWLLGGDYAAFGAWPLETVDRLRELDAEWIRGNVDRWTLKPPDDVAGARARRAGPLSAAARRGRRARAGRAAGDSPPRRHALLPRLALVGRRGLPARARPTSDARLLEGAAAERVVFGHTHLQFTREGPDGIVLTNPGSVGIPLDGDHRAAWAIVHGDGRVELRRTAYDYQASADAVRRSAAASRASCSPAGSSRHASTWSDRDAC